MHYSTAELAMLVRMSVALLCIIATVQFVLLPTLAEGFRQRIFELRRSMFLYMAEGNVEPNEPAYTQLRSTMNGLIANAECITFVRLVVAGTVHAKQGREYRERFDELLLLIPREDVRKQLEWYRQHIGYNILLQTLRTSPFGMLLTLILTIILLLAGIIMIGDSLRQRFAKTFRVPVHSIAADAEAEMLATGTM